MFYSSAHFGHGGGPITLSFLQCSGYEERLIDCRSAPTRVCSHMEDAGVRCQLQIGEFISSGFRMDMRMGYSIAN